MKRKEIVRMPSAGKEPKTPQPYETLAERVVEDFHRENDKPKMTAEEQSWIAYEEGYEEGYEAGVDDWEEVARRKAQLRAKGIPITGD
jgi:hypothetical protein